MSNHLIIGLGGTGGKVIREFRKRVYEEFRNNDPGHGVRIEYVYVDSSMDDLNDRKGWSVLGKSVHLGEGQKCNINGISASMLGNINMYPGLKGFLNPDDLEMMRTKMGPLISAGIGGQRRRLGRTLIANNLSDHNNPLNFESVVRGAVGRLQDGSDQDVTFHICAGTAGGTGSGTVVDAISQIREWFPYQPDTKSFKMRLMLYLPERTLVNAKHDAGFYQANGYAAMQEINALSVGKYHPVDITGKVDPFSGELKRLLTSQEAFEAAYVYTNVNESGKMLDIGHDLPAAVADFLFQTIIASNISGEKGQMSRLVGCENDGAGPEVDQAGNSTRSRKFISFGITRVEYPETEVREYATYNFASQASKQLTYNYWIDGQGFDKRSIEEVGTGYLDEIKKKTNRESLMLDNMHLTLQTPIIPNDNNKTWKEIDMSWETRTQRVAQDVQTSVDKKLWMSEFAKQCKIFFEDQFRNHGVKNFYTIQRKEIKAYAKFIRRHIETKFFNEWSVGGEKGKSVLEIEKYLTLLIQDCNDRIGDFSKQKDLQANENVAKATDKYKAAQKQWDENIGKLKDAITGATTNAFSQYKTALRDYYAAMTRMEAYDFAKELMQAIILELSQMKEGVLAFKDRINEINEEVERQVSLKCQTQEKMVDTKLKKYDPEKVHFIVRQYTNNRDYQEQNAQAIRNKLIANLGEDGERSFANLFDKTDYDATVNTILDICTENASRAMEETANADPLSKMVGVNILEKLSQELNSDAKLEEFVKQIIHTSSTYVQFNPEEKSKVFAGNTGAMMSMVQLSIPAADEKTAAFRQRLIDAFKTQIPNFSQKEDVSENYKSNQIVAISANSGFPLRYLANMSVLKEKYDALVNAPDGKFNRMVLHTESFKEPLPALFEMTPEELRFMILRPLMLAFTLGLVAEQQDPVSGERFLAIKSKGVFGDNWIKLGKDFRQCWEMLATDYAKAMQLKAEVDNELPNATRSNEQKAALKPRLGEVLNTHMLASLCENNKFHPNYPKYEKIAYDILEHELKEL